MKTKRALIVLLLLLLDTLALPPSLTHLGGACWHPNGTEVAFAGGHPKL